MEYKILESNGVETEYIDGAALNNLAASTRDGIIPQVLNECYMYCPASNVIAVSTGALLLNGFRVKITQDFTYSFVGVPDKASEYSIVARISVREDKTVTFTMDIIPTEDYVPDNTNILTLEQGEHTLEIGSFIYSISGVSNLVRKAPILILAEGVRITTIEQTKTSTEDNGINIITVVLTDGSVQTFRIKNGSKGKTGDSGLSYGASLSNEIGESDTDGYTKDGVHSVISNPNILINGDFRVNQRGKSSYEGYAKYTVDRWMSRSYDTVISPTADGLEIVAAEEGTTNTIGIIHQPVENYDMYAGKTVVLSAYISSINEGGRINIRVKKGSGVDYVTSPNITKPGFYKIRVDLPSTLTDLGVGISGILGTVFTVKYMKLELGQVATPNSPRPYAEELAMCQRYYQKIDICGAGFVLSGGVSLLNLPLLSLVRPTYTISVDSYPSALVNAEGVLSRAENLESSSLQTNTLEVGLKTPSLDVGKMYCFVEGKLSIDSEIYI